MEVSLILKFYLTFSFYIECDSIARQILCHLEKGSEGNLSRGDCRVSATSKCYPGRKNRMGLYKSLTLEVYCFIKLQEAGDSRAVKHVVYWRLPSAGAEENKWDCHVFSQRIVSITCSKGQEFKLNITVYSNNVMQVKGSTFLLWTLECYPVLLRQVEAALSTEVCPWIVMSSKNPVKQPRA